MILLIDEMYPPALAELLRAAGIDAITVREVGLEGAPDARVFEEAARLNRAVLTENVADYTRLAAACLGRGEHHPGLVIALATRFSRRRSHIESLVTPISALGGTDLADRTVYLERIEPC